MRSARRAREYAPTRRGTGDHRLRAMGRRPAPFGCRRTGIRPPFLSFSGGKREESAVGGVKERKSVAAKNAAICQRHKLLRPCFLNILMRPGNRVAAAMLCKPIKKWLGTQKFYPCKEPLSAQLLCIELYYGAAAERLPEPFRLLRKAQRLYLTGFRRRRSSRRGFLSLFHRQQRCSLSLPKEREQGG